MEIGKLAQNFVLMVPNWRSSAACTNRLARGGRTFYLDELRVLQGESELRQGVDVGDPRMVEHLLEVDARVRVHVQHLLHQVLNTINT